MASDGHVLTISRRSVTKRLYVHVARFIISTTDSTAILCHYICKYPRDVLTDTITLSNIEPRIGSGSRCPGYKKKMCSGIWNARFERFAYLLFKIQFKTKKGYYTNGRWSSDDTESTKSLFHPRRVLGTFRFRSLPKKLEIWWTVIRIKQKISPLALPSMRKLYQSSKD
jgi:hypothetical protein